MKLLLTIDTEGDCQWNAAKRSHVTTENARFLPRFQRLCEKYGFKPTYLTSYEMAKDDFFVTFARDVLQRGLCEVGMHLHAWNSPPIYNLTEEDGKYAPFLFQYPEGVIREKIGFLTELLGETFERKIVSHRAGRWGFTSSYAKILAEMGYKIECSVTPYINWNNQLGAFGVPGSDFRGFPSAAYFMDIEDISKAGESELLEVPVTVRPNYYGLLRWLYAHTPSGPAKSVFCRMFGYPLTWLRPNLRNFKFIMKMLEKEIESDCGHLEFVIHSSEFMPGGSPYFSTEAAVEQLYGDIEGVFQFLSNNDVQGVTCEEYYRLFKKDHDKSGAAINGSNR